MFYQNQILIEGRLCQTPQVKQTSNGKDYAQFSLCYNKPKKLSSPNENGYMYDLIPNFFNLTAWNKAATIASTFVKGDAVTVSGQLQFQNWIDKNTGEKKNKVSILVNSIKKLDVQKRKENFEKTDRKDEIIDDSMTEFERAVLGISDDNDPIPF